jgi:dihydropteroate synthase
LLGPPGQLEIGGRLYELSRTALIMGILNRTPDSFHERQLDLDEALQRAQQVVSEGGDLVDVGGVKAGAGVPVGVEEEIDRVCPVIEAISARWDVPISVDTFRAQTAGAALEAGATLVNDISGLGDPAMAHVVAGAGATLVLTHIQGKPRVPHFPDYHDLIGEVRSGLRQLLDTAQESGIGERRLLIDPGLDLGKTYSQSMVLLRELSELHVLGRPILLSVSHKGFLGAAAPMKVAERHEATLAALAYGFARGGRVMRVHDVKSAVRVCRTMEAVMTAEVDDPWVSRVALTDG